MKNFPNILADQAVFLSDLHVRSAADERYVHLINFLKNDLVKNSEQIFLLGDIFDLLIGYQEKYFQVYRDFFFHLKNILLQNKKVFFFQGNHDFHLKKLFHQFLQQNKLPENGFFLVDHPLILTDHLHQKIYLSHGDELEIENQPYQKYKKIIRSEFCRLLSEEWVSWEMLQKIGAYLAQKSKLMQSDFQRELAFLKYRHYAKILWVKNIDIIITGHGHIADAYENEQSQKYFNLGHTGMEPQFLLLKNNEYQFVPLD